MDGPLPDLVHDYELKTSYDRAFTIHFHSDPDAHPSAPYRQERWKKIRTLGHGGQGDVILQTCTDGRRSFTERAVKRIPLESEHSRRYYRRELECIIIFSHEKYSQYFVKFLGWYATSNKLHLAMEFLPEGDLYSYVLNHQRLAEEECSHITSQVLSGVAIMHERGFAHRDIKPQNILIYKPPVSLDPGSWWVKLADFGISKMLTTETTGTTLAPGTPLFMAPELLHSDSQSIPTRDHKIGDTWAIGITTFFLLTKTVPFKGQLAVLHYNGSSNELTDALTNCQVTESAQDFVLNLLNPRPGERLEAAEARQHSWIRRWLPDIPTSPAHSRPSTISSRRSSLQDHTGATREISTLASQTLSQRLTGDSHDLVISPKTPEEIHNISDIPVMIEKTETSMVKTESTTIRKSPRPESMGPNSQNDGVSRDAKMLTLFHDGLTSGNIDIVRSLVNLGVDVNFPDGNGQTPLHLSIHKGNVEAVRLLCKGGAEIEERSPTGYTPLQLAAKKGHTEVAELLLDMGANIEAIDSFEGSTPLNIAASTKNPALTRLLLDRGAKVQATDKSGGTPLHSAARWGFETVLKLLIQYGAQTEVTDKDGRTPLILATKFGSEGKIKQLILHVTDVNACDSLGYTALDLAASRGLMDAVILLIEKGANLEVHNGLGDTPLMSAVKSGVRDLVKILLDAGADINANDDQGLTPLIMAARKGHAEIVGLLLERKAHFYSTSIITQSPVLIQAAGAGHETVVDVLLKGGVDVETMDTLGETALVCAVRGNFERVVAILLLRGANAEAKDEHGESCLKLAAKNRNKAIMNLLIVYGAKKSLSYYRSLLF